jgi:hypothetical protein
LSSSRRSPYWTGEPRDKKSAAETHFQDILGKLRASGAIHEAPSRYEGRIAAYAPKAGPTYDYLAGLAAAAIRPRAAKAKQPAAEKLNKEQAWQQEIGGAAKSLTGLLQGTAAEKAQQEADPQAQREWQKAASQEFGQDIRERMHNERKTRGADVPLKLNRIGELLHDSLKKYDPSIDGPFDQWYDKAHDEAARLADHEIRSETAPVAGFKGKSLDAPVKSKTGDEGGTVESMTGGDVKQNIEALQEPKGKMEVIRRKAARMIHHLLRDTRPQTRDARIVLEGLNVEVAQKMGEGAWLYLKRMLDGKDPAEARAKWIGANHSMVAESRFDKMRNRVIEIARQRLPADHPNDRVRRMHDAMELLLDTPEVQANPVKATNRAPGEGPSPGYLILSNLRQQRVAREGGILL